MAWTIPADAKGGDVIEWPDVFECHEPSRLRAFMVSSRGDIYPMPIAEGPYRNVTKEPEGQARYCEWGGFRPAEKPRQ